METVIAPAVVGVLLVWMGILNLRGNLSTMHKYHYKRVSEEDKRPFCLLSGSGTIIIGGGMLLFSLLSLFAERTGSLVFTTVGAGLLIAAAVVGLFLSFYAMIKYNHGIF